MELADPIRSPSLPIFVNRILTRFVQAVHVHDVHSGARPKSCTTCLALSDAIEAWRIAAVEGTTLAFLPIYGPRGLRGMEAPALAGGPCTGLQSCPPAVLALSRVTGHPSSHLVRC